MTITKEYIKRLLKNELFVSFFLFIFGITLFSFAVNNKTLAGWIALVVIGGLYLVIGVGFYGMIKPIVLAFFRLVKRAIKVILADKIELSVRIRKQ